MLDATYSKLGQTSSIQGWALLGESKGPIVKIDSENEGHILGFTEGHFGILKIRWGFTEFDGVQKKTLLTIRVLYF